MRRDIEFILFMISVFILTTIMLGGMVYIQEGDISQAINASLLFSVIWVIAIFINIILGV